MGVREKLMENPRVASVLAVVIIVIGAGTILFNRPSGDSGPAAPQKMFLTIDDGKTFFPAPAEPLPPFQSQGKTAYRAYVFTCDGGKTKWVGYLERYSEQGKILMKEMWKKQATSGGRPTLPAGLLEGIEVTRPGEDHWVRQSDPAQALQVTNVHCPNEPNKDAEMVFP